MGGAGQRVRGPNSPSNLPEKLSVALHLFFFLFLFLASGMSIGWLDGMSTHKEKTKTVKHFIDRDKEQLREEALL